MLEPINRYEGHYYHKIEETVAVIDQVGSPRIKVCIDFFHMNIEEPDIAAGIERGRGYIDHVQLGDSNRFLPGEGHIDFAAGFAALNRIGYDKYLALECMVPEDPDRQLAKCGAYLHRCLKNSLSI
jgi:sugar phosphate isomerase/epimerase